MEKKLQTRAFRMQLNPGFKEEYKKRHDQLWPELHDLLKSAGIAEYHIFLDEDTHALFGVLQCPPSFDGAKLAQEAVMKKWWDYMADIMLTHPNNEPVAIPLVPVFYMK